MTVERCLLRHCLRICLKYATLVAVGVHYLLIKHEIKLKQLIDTNE